MKSATRPTTDDNANYAYVAGLRADEGEPRAQDLLAEVLALYPRYARRLIAPSPHGFASTDHEVLKTNADYLTRAHFSTLRGDVLRSAGGRCAYCYQVTASEVDHHLPRSQFGEYSIFSTNLTPICGTCNKKGDRYAREDGGQRYVHPYLDPLPTLARYLVAELEVSTVISITYSISATPGLTAEQLTMLKVQFADLGLNTRYGVDGSDEMLARLGSLYVYFKSGGGPEVAKYLDVDHRSVAAQVGENHWRSATLRAMADSETFCNGGFKLLGPDPQI